MYRSFIIAVAFMFFCFQSMMAQRIEKKDAHAVFIAPATMTPKEARYQTILKAQIDAVARTFGTIVSDENMSFAREKDNASSSDFFSLHEGDVRGVWLETIGDTIWSEPKHMADGSVVYEVRLKGKIMELENAPIAIETKLLFNGTNPDRNEIRDFSFQYGDKMYLYFKTPVDGYLAVYLVDYDDNMTTQRILPYEGEEGGIHKVMADKEYIFFSEEKAEPSIKSLVRECIMKSRTNHDFNQFYIIFSPNPFTKAIDKTIDENLPSELSFRDFQKWLSKIRRSKSHSQMCVEKIFVDIINKKSDNGSSPASVGQGIPLSDAGAGQTFQLNKKQQKELNDLQKDKWQTLEFGADLAAQFAMWHQMETEKNANGTDKYTVQYSEVEDANLQVAERRAWDDACAAIRSMANTHVQSSIKTEESFSTVNGKAESHSDIIALQRSRTNYAGTMNDLKKVMAIYKKTKSGYVVRMVVAKENK